MRPLAAGMTAAASREVLREPASRQRVCHGPHLGAATLDTPSGSHPSYRKSSLCKSPHRQFANPGWVPIGDDLLDAVHATAL